MGTFWPTDFDVLFGALCELSELIPDETGSVCIMLDYGTIYAVPAMRREDSFFNSCLHLSACLQLLVSPKLFRAFLRSPLPNRSLWCPAQLHRVCRKGFLDAVIALHYGHCASAATAVKRRKPEYEH